MRRASIERNAHHIVSHIRKPYIITRYEEFRLTSIGRSTGPDLYCTMVIVVSTILSFFLRFSSGSFVFLSPFPGFLPLFAHFLFHFCLFPPSIFFVYFFGLHKFYSVCFFFFFEHMSTFFTCILHFLYTTRLIFYTRLIFFQISD